MSEEKKTVKKAFTGQDGKLLLGLKSMAFKDYKAARILLNTGQLHQACFFINTCIEKELKTFLTSTSNKVPQIHDTDKLLNLVSQLNGITWSKDINFEYIKMVSKIYKSRYYEYLQPGYNFVINKNKFLAELDFIYSLLESKTKIQFNTNRKSAYQHSLEIKDTSVFENNYILNNFSKKDFLMKPEVVYEFRISNSFQILEIEYTISHNSDLDKFDYEGLKQLNDSQFTMSQANV